MQRILLVIPSMEGIGGAQRMVHSLSLLLSTPEREIFQASFDAPGVGRHFEGHVPFYALGPSPKWPLPLRPFIYMQAAWRLNRLKRRLGIDITISNLWRADLISMLSRGRDRKVALCHINIKDNEDNGLMMKLRFLVGAIYRRFDRVVAVSEGLAAELHALWHLPQKRISHIDNFVDRPVVRTKLPDDGVQRVVWCGRFVRVKNVDGLLHAWAHFVRGRIGAQLLLVGDGPDLSEIKELVCALGLRSSQTPADTNAQVIFVGAVDSPASYMLGARALVLSSHHEGLPMVVLEALSLGVPVLAADCPIGGVRKALLDQGLCQPERNDTEFTNAGALLPVPHAVAAQTLAVWAECLTLVWNDQSLWEAWRDGALERAGHFSSSVARDKWLQALDFTDALA